MTSISFNAHPLISRFSSSFQGCGKKGKGHKTLLDSLYILKNSSGKKVLSLSSQKKMLKKREEGNKNDNDFLKFLVFLGFSQKEIKNFFKQFENWILEKTSVSSQLQKNSKSYANQRFALANQEFALTFKKSSISKNKQKLKTETPFNVSIANNNKAQFIENQENLKYCNFYFAEYLLKEKNNIALHKIKFLKTFYESLQIFTKPSLVCKSVQIEDLQKICTDLHFTSSFTKNKFFSDGLSKISASKDNNEKKLDSFVSSYKEENEIDVNNTRNSNKFICEKSRDNVKPILETRKVRKGRVTYRVPLVTQPGRQEGKAITWLIKSALSRKNKVKSSFAITSKSFQPSLLSKMIFDKKRKERSIKYCFAEQLLDSYKGKGESVDKKKEFYKLALQNRAYTHYRWW